MITGSARFNAALARSNRRETRVTVTPPGGETVELPWKDCKVNLASAGIRRTASLSIAPTPGTDYYPIVSTPGARFTIEHGINFGAGEVELLPVFYGEVSQSPSTDIIGGEINLSLADMWQRIERCRFRTPFYPFFGTRGGVISNAMIQAIPDLVVNMTDNGGDFDPGNTWDRDRAQFIRDFATDGALDVYINSVGQGVIRPSPVINVASPSWVYRTGELGGNIKTAERAIPFDRLYNLVIVAPQDDKQRWSRQAAQIEDVNHPRHRSKVGIVPFFWTAPTVKTVGEAQKVARTILQRVIGTTETVNLSAVGHPGTESGDTVSIVHEATESYPGLATINIVDGGSLDCRTGELTLQTRSSAMVDLQES